MIVFLLFVLCAIPALVYSWFDPGFAIFVAPLIYAMTAISALAIWILLFCFRCPAWGRFVTLGMGLAIWSTYLGVTTHHAYTAQGRIERLLIDPVPESMRILDSGGRVGMAGGYEWVLFTVAPEDFDVLIEAGDFEAHEFPTPHVTRSIEEQMTMSAEELGVSPAHAYLSGDPGGSFLMLIANRAKDRIYFYRNRM